MDQTVLPDLRKIKIDKTEQTEAALASARAVCLCGLPGSGRHTALKMLLEKDTQIHPVYCRVRQIENGSALSLRQEGVPNWFLVSRPPAGRYPETPQGLLSFLEQLPQEDRVLFCADGPAPELFMKLVWSGIGALVLPESFRFTEEETWRYLKACKSRLNRTHVWHMTAGWVGCIAMLVQMERQLGEMWSVWELAVRPEIRRYIRYVILPSISDEDRQVLVERAPFPRLTEELERLLWSESDREAEERLLSGGAMLSDPLTRCRQVHPALICALDRNVEQWQIEKAATWYREHGWIQDALECCRRSGYTETYRASVKQNFDRITFLSFEKTWTDSDLDTPEFLYLEWMEHVLGADLAGLNRLREKVAHIKKSRTSHNHRITEILLNIAFTDPQITAVQWMKLLDESVTEGERIRLYYITGESASCLSGMRDLTELFAGGSEMRQRFRESWYRCISTRELAAWDLAELEYSILTGPLPEDIQKLQSFCVSAGSGTPWQIRLCCMYLAYLAVPMAQDPEELCRHVLRLADSFADSDLSICRWNARILKRLIMARQGQREELLGWIRDAGEFSAPDGARTSFYFSGLIQAALLIGEYETAGRYLELLIPYYRSAQSRRRLAEALFWQAIVWQEKGQKGRAMQTVLESVDIAAKLGMISIYAGWGRRGVQLLQQCAPSVPQEYAGVFRKMTEAAASAIRQDDLQEEESVSEPLTRTEKMVLEYMKRGLSNRQIAETMHVSLSTVKSHIYHIYRKLDVSTRFQAIRKAEKLES